MIRGGQKYDQTGNSWRGQSSTTRGEGGFTLVELIIVITILGILAGIVVFALGNTTTTAAQAACKADAKSVETAVEGYKAQNGIYPSPVAGSSPSSLGGAITYYGNLTGQANGGPWLRSAPQTTRYEIWFNSSGQVYVTKTGITVDPGDTATNDFDISNPNVCTTNIVQ